MLYNGFAEFLSDRELGKLYKDFFTFTQLFNGNISIILPFAIKNQKQETLGNMIGLKFKAKAKSDIINMVEEFL